MPSLYALFAKNCVLPAIDFAHGSFVRKQLKSLELSQRWSPEKLREYQLNKIKALLKHASITVPFYRRYFSENQIRLSHFCQIKDLEKLPIVNKKIISRNPDDFISSKYKKKLDKKNLELTIFEDKIVNKKSEPTLYNIEAGLAAVKINTGHSLSIKEKRN